MISRNIRIKHNKLAQTFFILIAGNKADDDEPTFNRKVVQTGFENLAAYTLVYNVNSLGVFSPNHNQDGQQ